MGFIASKLHHIYVTLAVILPVVNCEWTIIRFSCQQKSYQRKTPNLIIMLVPQDALSPVVALLTLGTHAQGGLQCFVCVSVCLCVCYSTSQFSHDYSWNKRYYPSQRQIKVKNLSDLFWKCFVVKLEHFLLVRLHNTQSKHESVLNLWANCREERAR